MRSSEFEGPQPLKENESPFSYIDAFIKGQKDDVFLARTDKKFSVSLIADPELMGAFVCYYLTPAYQREDPLMDMSISFMDLEAAKAYALRVVSEWNRGKSQSGKGNEVSLLPAYCFTEESPINYPQWQREDGNIMTKTELAFCDSRMARLIDVGVFLPVEDIVSQFVSSQKFTD